MCMSFYFYNSLFLNSKKMEENSVGRPAQLGDKSFLRAVLTFKERVVGGTKITSKKKQVLKDISAFLKSEWSRVSLCTYVHSNRATVKVKLLSSDCNPIRNIVVTLRETNDSDTSCDGNHESLYSLDNSFEQTPTIISNLI